MVDSTSDAIIADPQTFIENLFNTSYGTGIPSVASDFNIPKTFVDAFSDLAQLEKIPRLDCLPPASLKSGKLVRFLGMVQDTSYSQEIYVGMTKLQDARFPTQIMLIVRNGPFIDIEKNIILDERNGIYVTSIPGCSKWFNASESLESLSLDDSSVLRGDKERVMSHGRKEIGLVAKCYLGLENSLKVCDLVEIIGILEMPNQQYHEEGEDETGVVIHAVTVQKRQLNEVVLAKHQPLSSADIIKAMEMFLQHVAGLFGGDSLAAESVLLSLASSLTHRNPTPLGSLPVNIYATPTDIVNKVTAFICSILPAVLVESISIDSLNSQRIYPKSDGEQLSAGRGQLVPKTALIIDETQMREGKLQDMGVRNLRFLNRIAVAQKLLFEYPYHEFEIDTDISILVFGELKTILPVSISFPRKVSNASSTITNSMTQQDLELIRLYLAQISSLTVAINENIAEEMQNEFVRMRKETGVAGADEEWLSRRIIVAKGFARINARESVIHQDWHDSLQICSQWEARRK